MSRPKLHAKQKAEFIGWIVSMWSLSIVLAGLAVLNLTEFDILILWQLSVLTREYGHLFAVASLFVFVWTWRRRFQIPKSKRISIFWFSLIAAASFLRPVTQALVEKPKYQAELSKLAVGSASIALPEIFQIRGLFRSPFRSYVDYRRIEYKSNSGENLHLDFYPANRIPDEKPRPLVLIVHGGGWEGGTTQQLPVLNQDLVAAGFAVASVSYRFSPQTRWPGQAEDVNKGIDTLLAMSEELGFDPSQWVLLGRSAGAQIAGVIAYTRQDLPVRGYIGFYGPTDLKFGFEITVENDILDSRNILRRFLGGEPYEAVDLYTSASVIEASKTRPVPTLLLYGVADRLVWYKHGERLKSDLQSRRVPVALISMPWGVHGFDFNPAGPGGQISREAVLYFVRSVFSNEGEVSN